MRKAADFTATEWREYLQGLAAYTAVVVPEDAVFLVVVIGPDNVAHYVSSPQVLNIPSALRELANTLDDDIK